MKTYIKILCVIAVAPFLYAEEKSYSAKLKEVVDTKKRRIKPLKKNVDTKLISIEQGATGLKFGDSLDDLVEMWGKPSGIYIHNHGAWQFYIDATYYQFIDNKLVSIGIHSATMPDAYMKNGLSFKSTLEEFKKLYPQAEEKRRDTFTHYTENDYVIEFTFYPTYPDDELKLSAITLSHPDAAYHY